MARTWTPRLVGCSATAYLFSTMRFFWEWLLECESDNRDRLQPTRHRCSGSGLGSGSTRATLGDRDGGVAGGSCSTRGSGRLRRERLFQRGKRSAIEQGRYPLWCPNRFPDRRRWVRWSGRIGNVGVGVQGREIGLPQRDLGSISSTFYTQLLHVQIPKLKKDTDNLAEFLYFWDLHTEKLCVKCWWNRDLVGGGLRLRVRPPRFCKRPRIGRLCCARGRRSKVGVRVVFAVVVWAVVVVEAVAVVAWSQWKAEERREAPDVTPFHDSNISLSNISLQTKLFAKNNNFFS